MKLTSIKLLIGAGVVSFRNALVEALGRETGICVVGTAGSAGEALRLIRKLEPDVLTVEPGIPNLTAVLADAFGTNVLPVIAVGKESPASDLPGLCDFVRKPDVDDAGNFFAFCNELCVKVKISYRPRVSVPVKPAAAVQSQPKDRHRLIVIGASTGGTEATAEILRRLPGNLPGIVIAQHMPPGFTRMYAERLDGICSFRVSEAQDGVRVQDGTALVAPGGKQMTVKKNADGYYVQCREGPKVNGHCPSVGVLFESAAEAAGADALGIILTGMGRDGAEGLLAMKNAGAYTIGQDRQSCVVYGMPMAAQEIGAVAEQAPPEKIAEIVVRRVRG